MSWDIPTQVATGIASSVAGRALFSFLKGKFQGRQKQDFVLDRFFEREQYWVGIHNGQTAMDGCIFMADDIVCQWWDDHSIEPRIVVAGGGGNILVTIADQNPLIKLVCRGKVIAKRRFLDITPRH